MKTGREALNRYIGRHYEGSVSKFAKATGLDQSDLSKILRGVRKNLTVEYAKRIEVATRGEVPIPLWAE